MQTRLKDEHHPSLVERRYLLAESLVQSGSLKDAEALLRELADTLLQKERFLLILTGQVILLLVSVLEELGKADEAEKCQKVLEELLLKFPAETRRDVASTLDEFISEEEKRLFEEWSTSPEDELFLRDYVENKNEVTDEMDEFVEKFTSSDQNGSAERSHVGTESSLHLASCSAIWAKTYADACAANMRSERSSNIFDLAPELCGKRQRKPCLKKRFQIGLMNSQVWRRHKSEHILYRSLKGSTRPKEA